jgi:hypothetical protein
MNWDSVQQLIRIVLQFLSGVLVGKGILDAANAEVLTGAMLSISSVVWWWFWNRNTKPAT